MLFQRQIRDDAERESDAAAPPRLRTRTRVALFSISYADTENRKAIAALADRVQIRIVSPARWDTDPEEFRRGSVDASPHWQELFYGFTRVPLAPATISAHYALASLSLGFRRLRPHVVQVDADPWNPTFWQALLARHLFAPAATMVVGPKKNTYREYDNAAGRTKRRLAEAGLARVDFALPASAMAKRMYAEQLGFPAERMQVTTMVPVDVGAFRPAEPRRSGDGPLIVGYSGRFHAQKGITDLVEAVDRCVGSGMRVRLRLLGSGPLKEDLLALARDRDHLEILPPVPLEGVAEFMRGLDVFAVPSRVELDHEEHDGHAALQALACGLPTVGARSGILNEILADDVGILVGPADAGELAGAIGRLGESPELRRRLGEAGRAKAIAEYSIERFVDDRTEIYDRLRGGR